MPAIPVFVQQIVGVGVRALILWLAAKFGAELSDDQVVQIVAQVLPVALVIIWSIWQKYVTRQGKLTAITVKGKTTEAKVDAIVAGGGAPSVMSAKDAVL